MRAWNPPVAVCLALSLLAAPLMAQEERASFDTPVVLLPADGPPFQKLLDFDGDGFMDAVGHRFNSDGTDVQVVAWQNDQQGGFDQVYESTGLSFSGPTVHDSGIAVGDFNGDGLDDFFVSAENGTLTFVSQGNGSFTRYDQAEPLGDVRSIVAGDFDGDLMDDRVLLIAAPGFIPVLKVLWSSGGALIESPPLPYSGGMVLTLAEADGDALDDLLIWPNFGSGPKDIHLYSFAGKNLVQGPILSSAENSYKAMFDAADIDGDGDEDIVGFHVTNDGETVEVFRRMGSSSWLRESAAAGGPAEFLADIDGDGDPDGVCCGGGGGGGGGNPPTWPMINFESTFQISLNDGTGAFSEAFEFQGLGSEQLAGVADVDHDGDADMVAGACVYYADGPLTETPTPWLLGTGWYADIDRDGDVDMPYPHFLLEHLDTYVNLGNGRFENRPHPGIDAPAGYYFRSVIPGDFTGDGATDYLTYMIEAAPSYQFSQMYLIENNGSGQFSSAGPAAAPGVEFRVEQYAISYLVGDVDGDGDEDLFARSNAQTPRRSVLYLNNGAGYFTQGQALPMKVEAIVDVDGDGLVDVVGARNDLQTGWVDYMSMAYGLGGGAFGAPSYPFGTTQPDPFYHPIEVVDFNDDGLPDVAFIDQTDEGRLFLNTTQQAGQAAFALSTVLDGVVTADENWPRVRGVDVNLDGFTDIVVGPLPDTPDTAQIHLRIAGTGGLLTAADYRPASRQILPRLEPVDFDGNGAVDMAATHLFRNRTLSDDDGGFCEQYGEATPTAGGNRPTLGAIGPFRVGSAVELVLSGAVGGSLGVLTIGMQPSSVVDHPKVGLTAYNLPWAYFRVAIVGGPSGQEGAGLWRLPFAVPPQAAGIDLYHQFIVLDPVMNMACSNGLRLHYGN